MTGSWLATAPHQTAMHAQGPILAIDVQYSDDDTGYAAGVVFESVDSSSPTQSIIHVHPNVSPYEAGAFYKRELPPILALLDKMKDRPAIIIVDGFVDLDGPGRPGLGRHLYDCLDRKIIIIGVAKNPFRKFEEDRRAPSINPHVGVVHRGSSSRALFVTAAGIAVSDAVQTVKGLHGNNRLPTMLKLVDRAARIACSEDAACQDQR